VQLRTVEGSSRYTTSGRPMREMATLSRRFIPPEKVRTCKQRRCMAPTCLL
jgi:hypothetical protein